MKKLMIFTFAICLAMPVWAAESINGNTAATLSALWTAAFLTAVIHTIAGPDHYLPFIAIAKSRGYSLKKTLLWTFICGIGHIGSALLIALAFIYFSHWLSKENFAWIEDNRGDIAAYALIGLGAAYLLWALRRRLAHKQSDAGNNRTKEHYRLGAFHHFCPWPLRSTAADSDGFQRFGNHSGHHQHCDFLFGHHCNDDAGGNARLARN